MANVNAKLRGARARAILALKELANFHEELFEKLEKLNASAEQIGRYLEQAAEAAAEADLDFEEIDSPDLEDAATDADYAFEQMREQLEGFVVEVDEALQRL